MKYIKEVKTTPLWNSGYCSLYDFSQANSSEEARIEAVTTVANVCRGDKGVKNPKELYQQLLTEHNGKAGSVFEFVPVELTDSYGEQTEKFGTQERVEVFMAGNYTFTYTNLRACIADNLNTYNNNVDGFFVFKVKVPQMIVKHILRHRMLSFQEMSERTNKLREYYYCDELKELHDLYLDMDEDSRVYKDWNELCCNLSQRQFDFHQKDKKIRQELLNKGSHGLAYTTLWIAGWKQDPNGYKNMFNVRCGEYINRKIGNEIKRVKNDTQIEMRQLCETMQQMMEL